MTGDEGEDTWQTFNKQFDALFAKNCYNGQGGSILLCTGYQFPLDLMTKSWISLKQNLKSCHEFDYFSLTQSAQDT